MTTKHHHAALSCERDKKMAIGPVQLIVPGINHPASTVRSSPNWSGSTRAARSGVIDSLAVYKDADGEA